ncbi:MAG: twin-arginine translocase subunit TatC [Brevinematales bacterium]|nr:twin-arginine translocase subunit TatC [Brevinematales bacterium]
MGDRELTYWDHLEELRRRILFCLGIFVCLSLLSFLFLDEVLLFLKKPLGVYGINLNYFKPYEKFFIYIKLSFFCGLILSLPFLLIQLVSFVLPALKENEKFWFLFFSLLSLLIFIGSLLFSYFIVLPLALRFFVNFAGNDGSGMLWGVSGYVDFFSGIVLSTTVVFQLPLIMLFLLKLKIIKVSQLIRWRKFVVLGIAIFAAVFSPPDVVSMILVGVPLYLLFEISLVLGRLFDKKSL